MALVYSVAKNNKTLQDYARNNGKKYIEVCDKASKLSQLFEKMDVGSLSDIVDNQTKEQTAKKLEKAIKDANKVNEEMSNFVKDFIGTHADDKLGPKTFTTLSWEVNWALANMCAKQMPSEYARMYGISTNDYFRITGK